MTQTPNIGLKKIDGSENWRNVFNYHNDSMDLADEAIAGVRAGLTYVENGDTIAANANYTAGKFITWKGEIYRVKATINTTVTSANWTTYLDKMDGMGGALSQINGDLASLNSNFTKIKSNVLTTSHTVENSVCSRSGSQVLINASVKLTSNVSTWSTFATIPDSLHPNAPTRGFAEIGGEIAPIYIGSAGNLQFTKAEVASGTVVVLVLSYNL